MRVALNAQLLSTTASYRTAGISRVVYELLAHLRSVSSPFDFLIFAPDSPGNRRLLGDSGLNARLTRLPTERPAVRIAWEQLALPIELLRGRASLLHALAFVSPLAWRGPTVVTAYDLSFLRYPEAFNRANRLYLARFVPPSLRRADRVIAISEHTRRDVIELCEVPPERVTTIHLAADGRFHPADPVAVARFRAVWGLPERFILYLGTLQPRKNVATLVRAYARLRAGGFDSHALVLAGGKGWQYEAIFALVRELGVERDVLFPGYVPENEQALWYTAADLFAYPSLYEGFGLQLLEAMACGTPVVTSNSSSLPEVVGDAGVLVEPMDVEGLASALRGVLEDDERRARLREAGLARAREFSWRRMAQETVRVYADVLGAQ
jgi:glycosyltransferase involved in cell wall biosynthesis